MIPEVACKNNSNSLIQSNLHFWETIRDEHSSQTLNDFRSLDEVITEEKKTWFKFYP